MSAEAIPTAATAAGARRARRPGVGTVYRWELRKLRVQKRTYLGLGAVLVIPLIFVVALLADSSGGGPDGVPFGQYVRQSGLAVPLVTLSFGSIWLMPLVTALVAGDIVATEDQHGTLKTILTRSAERWHVFAGKALAAFTYALLALVVFVGVGLVAGGLAWGFDPVTSLSGTVVQPGRGLVLLAAGTLTYYLPILAVASIALLLSTVTHNSAAAVVGTLMVSILFQLVGIISALDFLQPYLLSEQFNAWQGLLRDPVDWAPVVRAAWVSALYAAPALGAALVVFVRRDVTGG
jgi:ABC-2 type transport system permease protein